jgi:hypothetical protein
MTIHFSSNHIPEVEDWLDHGVPCPFCKERMEDYNVCTRFSDLIDDVVFYCDCDGDTTVDTFYNFKTLEKINYDPYSE